MHGVNNSNNRALLGIMVTEHNRKPPFAQSTFFENLALTGAASGIEVFVFSPNRIDWKQRSVTGYTYTKESKAWIKRVFPLPALVYDRCFFSRKESYLQYRLHVSRLRKMPEIRFLGYGLSGKWDVQQMLQKDDDLKGYLPETRFLTSGSELLAWLRERTDVILKPQGGSQGKGVLHVQRVLSVDGDESYSVKGRDAQNVPIERSFCHFQSCWRWLCRIIGQRPYLIQQYLTLHNSKGMSFDIRSLVQKNGRGLWETTGMAVRIGQPGSLTSNLHGGGSVDKVSPFLEREFGASKAQELAAQLKKLSSQIPPALEAHHGRLAELGIDLGIDASGRVWILEVNSKPGRTVFERIRNKKARIKSITNPIRYAEYLLFKKLG